MSDAAPIRVLIADDETLLREGIASLLGIQPGIEIVGMASDGREAVELALALHPDVVLMDVRMPGVGGVQATAELRERLPSCRVVMLTVFNEEDLVLGSVRAGASGYLLKALPSEELAQAVRLVHAGVDLHHRPTVRHLVAALDRAEPVPRPRPDLTEREFEVLRLVANGGTNRQIAKQLFLSEGTVKNHVSHILTRLGLRDRVQATIYARENGLA